MSICELTRTGIQALIPHRDPFLFLDYAWIESENEVYGHALWTAAHPILQGHFPQKPIVPGVCLIEAGAQLAGVLLHWQSQKQFKLQNGFGVLASVRNAKFKLALVPEELLVLNCRVRTLSPHAYLVQCTGTTDESRKIVFESEILLAQQVPTT